MCLSDGCWIVNDDELTVDDEHGAHAHRHHCHQAAVTQRVGVLQLVDSTRWPPPCRHLTGVQLTARHTHTTHTLIHPSTARLHFTKLLNERPPCCLQAHLRDEASLQHQTVPGHHHGFAGTRHLGQVVEQLQSQRSLTVLGLAAQHRLPAGGWRFTV